MKAKLGDLQRLLAPLTANGAELGHLEATRARFAELLAQAENAANRQGVRDGAAEPGAF